MKRMGHLKELLAVATFLGAVGQSSTVGCSSRSRTGGERYNEEFQSGGSDRQYILYAGDDYDNSAAPVVVVFHGWGMDTQNHFRNNGFQEAADEHGFILAIPAGTPNNNGGNESWNGMGSSENVGPLGPTCDTTVNGHYGSPAYANCPADRSANNDCSWTHCGDDVQFTRDLLDDIESKLCVDRERIYVTGFSNGGFMTYELGLRLGDRVAAIVPVGVGVTWGFNDAPDMAAAGPMPVLHVQGRYEEEYPPGLDTDDTDFVPEDQPVLPYSGWKAHTTVATFNVWAEASGCDGNEEQPFTSRNAPFEGVPANANNNQNNGANLECYSATGCEVGAEVMRCYYDGGHEWFGYWANLTWWFVQDKRLSHGTDGPADPSTEPSSPAGPDWREQESVVWDGTLFTRGTDCEPLKGGSHECQVVAGLFGFEIADSTEIDETFAGDSSQYVQGCHYYGEGNEWTGQAYFGENATSARPNSEAVDGLFDEFEMGYICNSGSAGSIAPSHPPSPQPSADDYSDVLFLGDSDIEGWNSDAAFPGSTNRGVGGWTCGRVASKLNDGWYDRYLEGKTRAVLVCGENDLFGANVEETFSRFQNAFRRLTARSDITQVVYMGTKPEPDTGNLHDEYRDYDHNIRGYASEQDGPFLTMVDVYPGFEALGNPRDFYQRDGLHLTRVGYSHWNTWATQALAADRGACSQWRSGACVTRPGESVERPAEPVRECGSYNKNSKCSRANEACRWSRGSCIADNRPAVCADSEFSDLNLKQARKKINQQRKFERKAGNKVAALASRIATLEEDGVAVKNKLRSNLAKWEGKASVFAAAVAELEVITEECF